MDASSPIPNENEDRLLPRPGEAVGERSSMGPLVGVAIIVILMIAGALYFWGARLNAQDGERNPPPYIPPEQSSENIPVSTTTVATTSAE